MNNISREDMEALAAMISANTETDCEITISAIAWTVINRFRSQNRKSLGEICRMPADRSRGEYSDVDETDFSNLRYCRVLAISLLSWIGDLPDPTCGARRFHGHDEAPEWSADREAMALIGSYLFFA